MLEIVGLGLGAAALLAAFGVPGGIEALKRPRLEIRPSPWSPSGPVPWTFAAVQVHNKPLGAPFNRLLSREAAQGCVVEIDFFRWGSEERVIPTVPGRWSSHPEPIRSVPSAAGTGAVYSASVSATGSAVSQTFSAVYDPSLDPREHDVPVSHAGEEVAVAIMMPRGAFAFSTASYGFHSFANPSWGLDRGTYRVLVRVRGSSLECERAFKLEYLTDDFAKFRLQEI
jgi:hypothetical protein